MGSSSSKFKKYLQHGDEYAAMQVYQTSPELRRDLDPNSRRAVNAMSDGIQSRLEGGRALSRSGNRGSK